MFVPSAGRRRLPAAIAAASVCAVTLLVHVHAPPSPRRRRARGRSAPAAPLDDAGYARRRRRTCSAGSTARWNARLAPLRPGPGRHDARWSTPICCSSTRSPRSAAFTGRSAPTPGRARSSASSPARRSGTSARRPAPTRRSPGPGGRRRRTARPSPGLRQLDVVDGLVHAYLARDALGLDAADGGPHPPTRSTRGDEPRLPLARPAAEPDQLVLRALRRRRDRQRRARRARRPAWRTNSRASSPACRGHGGAAGNLGPGLRFHYLPAARARTRRSNVDSAEYANIVLSFSRYYGLAREAGMRAARAARPAARVGAARAQRLLDAQRLHELGQRPRLRALAPAQEDRAGAARADRRRGAAGAPARAGVGRVGQVDARSRAARLRRARRPRAAASRRRSPTA